jgi:hypothetical protein
MDALLEKVRARIAIAGPPWRDVIAATRDGGRSPIGARRPRPIAAARRAPA